MCIATFERMTTSVRRSTMTTIILWSFIGLIFSNSVQAYDPNSVTITPEKSVAVKVGDPLFIMCKANHPLRLCRVEIPNEPSTILSAGQPAENGIEYYGNSTNFGECGVHIAHVKAAHEGKFKCSLTINGSRSERDAYLDIVIAHAPQAPEIHLSPGTYGNYKYKTGDELVISCIARAGRPAANVSLYLDDELIAPHRPGYNTNANVSLDTQTASRIVDWTDNGKILRCVANHVVFNEPKETRQEIEVYFGPQEQSNIENFGYVIGRPGNINITIHANPKPRFVWHIDGEEIPEGTTDDNSHFQSSSAVNLGKGAWAVELKIDGVQKVDTEKEYILEARNDHGAYKYTIRLSTADVPTGVDLDAGSIIGIAVGVLVLILIVFLIIFARATGRWCFAARRRGDEETAGGAGAGSEAHITPGDEDEDPHIMDEKMPHGGGSSTRNIGESSDTESAGRYSRTEVDGAGSGRRRRPKITFSQLFKRNKDKVSGADTDTVRTVVTVDDEKVQNAESAADSQRTNPTGEGGIVYAELDLTQQQQGVGPRRISDDKTEYAEIVYTKPAEGTDVPPAPEK